MPTMNATLDALVDEYGIVGDEENDAGVYSASVSIVDGRRRRALDAVLRAAGFETDASGRITRFVETLDGARRKRARGRDAEDASDSDVPPPLSARLGLDRRVDVPATTAVAVATTSGNAGREGGARGTEKTVDDERLATTTATTGGDKKTRDAKAKSKFIVDWMKSCEVTYERVLLMRSLDVDDALERAREVGVRSSRADFIKCLEEHGVAFSQTKKRRRANQAAAHAVETT